MSTTMERTEESSNWVCPNDRELMLRAKLETGWSVKTSQFQSLTPKPEGINEQEKKMILQVISRAQQSENLEKNRVSKMIDKLNNMKRNARGDGESSCILCNESFGLFSFQAHQCQGCCKLVCSKCGVDTVREKKEIIWFCKICSETKEILKKSGSWFYNSDLSTNLESLRIPDHESVPKSN